MVLVSFWRYPDPKHCFIGLSIVEYHYDRHLSSLVLDFTLSR